LINAPIATTGGNPGKILFSGIHFPNVDGQPPGSSCALFFLCFAFVRLSIVVLFTRFPSFVSIVGVLNDAPEPVNPHPHVGKLSQLQFRGSFSQATGCKCPNGNCESLLNNCADCKSGTCLAETLASCVNNWMASGVCPATTPEILAMGDLSTQTFLQMSFGGLNFLRNTSSSADGAVGMPGWCFPNPLLTNFKPDNLRHYVFANPKALTALVQIDNGKFFAAEWNWEKADSRCRRCAASCSVALTFVLWR
jgi:hypothetical protein